MARRSSLSSTNPEASTTSVDQASNDGGSEKDRSLVVIKEGRPYLAATDSTAMYPLPVDLAETNRHTMLSLLASAVFKAPFLSRELLETPPHRVLELGCDSGFWSALCHKHFQSKAHQASFIGIDIKPPPPGVGESYRSMGMDWEYIQYDLREPNWPLQDESVDLVMIKNVSLVVRGPQYSRWMAEVLRILKPAGTAELWGHDFTIRSLRPQGLDQLEAEDNEGLAHLRVYPVGNTVPFGPSTNPFVRDYNAWIKSALQGLGFTAVPCAMYMSLVAGRIIEGSDALGGVINKRLAVPLAPIKWDMEHGQNRALTDAQAAIRQTALDSFIAMVEAFQPLLREVSGKNDDEWAEWLERAKRDWMQGDGLSLGECFEFGVLSMTKKDWTASSSP